MKAPTPLGCEPASAGALDWDNVRHVLLIRLRSIGDTVLMTPCLSAIKSWRPGIRISVLSEPLAAPLLEGHEAVDSLLVCRPGALARTSLVRKLRRSAIDIAYNMHGGTTATLIAAASGAAITVGYGGYRYSWLLGRRAPSPDRLIGRRDIHSVEQQLALLGWTGVPDQAELRLRLPLSPEAGGTVRNRLNALGLGSGNPRYSVLSPGASSPAKIWPPERFVRLAEHLKDRHGLTSLVIAGPGDDSRARFVEERARGSAMAVGALSLKEVVALIAGARLFAGCDSGPMHVAAAFERPIVALFGPSDATVWRPWTRGPCIVLSAREFPAPDRPSVTSRDASDCAAIPVEAVLDAADAVVAENFTGKEAR